MRLFRQYIYRLAKEDTAGSLCRRIGEALEKAGTPAARSLFFFSDSAHGKVSVVDRCAKRYPSLASSGLTLTDSMGQQSRALTNLPAPWDETNPTAGINPEWALLAEIGEGIPRSYPFHYALMIADGIDWFKTGIKVREPALHEQKPSCHIPHAYLSPSIGVYNNWWTPHRMAGLWATVEIEEPPSDAPRLPEFPGSVDDLLHQLGSIHTQQIIVAASDRERQMMKPRIAKGKILTEELENGFHAFLEGLTLPFDLPPDHRLGSFDSVSPKDSIVAIFKPRGYRYRSNQSGQGVYVLAKLTPANNQIELLFDFAPIARCLSCSLIYRGPLWRHHVNILFGKGQVGIQYPITGQEVLTKVVQNAGAIIDALERTFIPQMDGIYGPAPAWFEYGH